jgi:hypothetical protein
MRHIPIVILLMCLISCHCHWRKYPSEKYNIPQKYRDLISSFKAGDTLKYQDDKGSLSTFLIQRIDSTLHDKRGYLINMKEYKDISIVCHELINARHGFEDYDMIVVMKNPETDSVGFNLRLKDFYSIDTTFPIVLKKDTVTANNLSFTNYYFFHPQNHSEQKESNSVTQIYMTNQDGIVAYKCLNGVWWTKVK